MGSSLVTIGLTVALKLLEWFLTRAGANAETQKAFLNFVSHLEERQMIPVKAKNSYKDQLARLQEEIKKNGG